MITLKRHWLAIILALAAVLLLVGFVHRCGTTGAGGTLKPSAITDGSASPTTPATTASWLASLDWQTIGMAVGALLTGIGAFYQLLLKWRAGAVSVEALIDGGKTIFGEAKDVQAAFTKPAVSVPPTPTMPPANNDVVNAALKKMDQPATMSVPSVPPAQEKASP